MKQTKLFFTDLDDTLLNSRKEVSAEDRASMEAALAAGHKIVINTGRPLPAVLPLIRRLSLERPGCFASSYNGGLLYDCGSREILSKKTLPLPYVRHLFGEAGRQGLYAQTYDSRRLLCLKYTRETRLYCQASEIGWEEDPDFLDKLREEPVKVVLISYDHPERLHAFRLSQEEWARGKVSSCFSSDFLLEYVAEGISKGGAVRFLCEHLGIPLSATVAAGDAENDIPMLKAAAVGAAVSNASPEVKAAADYVARRDCNHSAVSEILHRFLLDPEDA